MGAGAARRGGFGISSGLTAPYPVSSLNNLRTKENPCAGFANLALRVGPAFIPLPQNCRSYAPWGGKLNDVRLWSVAAAANLSLLRRYFGSQLKVNAVEQFPRSQHFKDDAPLRFLLRRTPEC